VGQEKVLAVDIFRDRVTLRSEEHGTRVVELERLLEEIARAGGDAGSAPVAPAATVTAPPEPPVAPVPEPAPAPAVTPAQNDAAQPGEARSGRRRRRRRRRGGGGGGGAGPQSGPRA